MKPGTKDVKSINESIDRIEGLTKRFKRNKMSTKDYIKEVHISLSKLTNERDYIKYLESIGQNK